MLTVERNTAGLLPWLLPQLQDGSLGNPPAPPKVLCFPYCFLGIVSLNQVLLGLGSRKKCPHCLLLVLQGGSPLVTPTTERVGMVMYYKHWISNSVKWNNFKMLISYVYCVVNRCYTSRIPEIFLASHKVQIYVYKYKCIKINVYIIAPIYMIIQFVFLE